MQKRLHQIAIENGNHFLWALHQNIIAKQKDYRNRTGTYRLVEIIEANRKKGENVLNRFELDWS